MAKYPKEVFQASVKEPDLMNNRHMSVCLPTEVTVYCKACGHELVDTLSCDYSICDYCRSGNYVSMENAETDNQIYFNSVYSTNSNREVISAREVEFIR